MSSSLERGQTSREKYTRQEMIDARSPNLLTISLYQQIIFIPIRSQSHAILRLTAGTPNSLIDRKCPNFSLQLYLRTRGELMLANFGLKTRPFWDADLKKWYSCFSRKYKAFCENNLHQITYLPKSYLWTKNEGNRCFNSCHSMVDISWQSLLKGDLKEWAISHV